MSEPSDSREELEILALARHLARGAGGILRDRYETPLAVDTKSSRNDLVTEVDRASEAFLVDTLRRERPGDAVLAEEGGARAGEAASRWRWVIDPLDGTTNFAHGYPRFCVSIGVEHRGEVRVAVVYEPLRDELFEARRGAGATRNGEAIRVSSADTFDDALVATGFAYDIRESEDDNRAAFSRVVKAVRGIRRAGSAALDCCSVACGRLDGYWEHKLKAWDVAAGHLLVEEAGGRVSDYRGGPAPPSGAEIVATNGAIHNALLAVLADA